jgi:superfamily II DNA or RNA helicase
MLVHNCHHAASPSYQAILEHFKNARVVGVTATADRADGKPLANVFTQVVHRIEIDEAIEAGYLTPVRGVQVTVPGMDLSQVRTRRQSRKGGEDTSNDTIDLLAPSGQARVLADTRERVSVDLHPGDLGRAVIAREAVDGVVGPLLELAGVRKTIVFAVDKAHAQTISDAINTHRPGAARWLWHKTPDRKQVQEDHKSGKFQFLVNVMLLTEGYDDPSIECVAMARPTQSRVLYCQAVGRALRLFAGKREALLLDFVGVGCKFDLVGPEDVLGKALTSLETIGELKRKPADIDVSKFAPRRSNAFASREALVAVTAAQSSESVKFTTRVIELVRGLFRRKK